MTPDADPDLALDDDALARKYLRYSARLALRLCRLAHLRDEAESIAYVSLARTIALRHRVKVRRFRSVLIIVTHNDLRNYLRKQARHTRNDWSLAAPEAPHRPHPLDPSVACGDDDAFEWLVSRASACRRDYLRLVFRDGYPKGEAAVTIAGKSLPGNGKFRGFREVDEALTEIRACLAPQIKEDQ